MSAVIGCDPGTRGGVAVLRTDGTPSWVFAFRPEMTRGDFKLAMRTAAAELDYAGGHVGFLEKVGYRPGDGGKGEFTFGRAYGWCEMGLAMANVDVRDVLPMMWQSRLECLTGGDKNVSKRRAAELWPQMKMTHAIADALLIAEYGRRVLAGK